MNHLRLFLYVPHWSNFVEILLPQLNILMVSTCEHYEHLTPAHISENFCDVEVAHLCACTKSAGNIPNESSEMSRWSWYCLCQSVYMRHAQSTF